MKTDGISRWDWKEAVQFDLVTSGEITVHRRRQFGHHRNWRDSLGRKWTTWNVQHRCIYRFMYEPIQISLRNNMILLRMSSRDRGLVAIRKLKGKKLHELEGKYAKHVVRIIKNFILRTAESFQPNDPKNLLLKAVNLCVLETGEKLMIRECMRNFRTRNMYKIMLHSIVYGNLY